MLKSTLKNHTNPLIKQITVQTKNTQPSLTRCLLSFHHISAIPTETQSLQRICKFQVTLSEHLKTTDQTNHSTDKKHPAIADQVPFIISLYFCFTHRSKCFCLTTPLIKKRSKKILEPVFCVTYFLFCASL